jgi:excisionase family DNA binding protein
VLLPMVMEKNAYGYVMSRVLCDVLEAADALSVGRSKVYELMNAGSLESVKIGKRRLVVAASIDGYVASLMEAR